MKLILVLIGLFLVVNGAWYYRENKICDPVRSNIVSFTGFRINRKYKLLGLGIPKSTNLLEIAYCNHGEVNYGTNIKLKSSIDINWDQVFCMIKPKINKVGVKVEKISDKLFTKDIMGKSVEVKNSIKRKFDYIFENQVNKVHSNQVKDGNFESENLQSQDDLSNLVCYKMARRRKYAKRDLLFYIPETFVGGLFECSIPTDKQEEIFRNLTNQNSINIVNFECDPTTAKPLLPLLAADSTSRWFEYDILKNPLNPSIVQTIPYLTSVTPFNIRFSAMESSDMYKDTWANKIDVNEKYSYSEIDLNIFYKAFAISTDYLNKLYSPPEVPQILSQFNLGIENLGTSIYKILMADFKNMNLQDKIGLIFSYKNKRFVRTHLKALQKIWDDLVTDE